MSLRWEYLFVCFYRHMHISTGDVEESVSFNCLSSSSKIALGMSWAFFFSGGLMCCAWVVVPGASCTTLYAEIDPWVVRIISFSTSLFLSEFSDSFLC